MTRSPLNALVLIATCALFTTAAAQTAYKCGNSYSQQPCTGGSAVDVLDQRSAEQKNQAISAARQDARLANTLEQTRLTQEAQRQIAQPAPSPAHAPAPADSAPPKKAGKKPAKSTYFTSQVPGSGKKKGATSKNTSPGKTKNQKPKPVKPD